MEEIKKTLEEVTKSFQKMLEETKERRDYKLVEGGDEISIEIDMPGLEPEDVTVAISKDGTSIRVEGVRGDRKYSKRIKLPVKIDPATATAFYRRGVLFISAKISVEEEIRIKVEG